MIVASFYAPRPEEEKKRWGCNYDELLMLVEAGCRRFGLEHVVISDTPRPKPLKTFLVNDLPENLMQAFLVGQREVLSWSPDYEVLFIGADCLITKDPRGFGGDISITLGPFSDCEMNTGAVWANNPPKLESVWQKALDLNPVEWGDDQRAIYKSICNEIPRGLEVNFLRCEDHNWAPDHINDNAGMPTVVHFRGMRKEFMLAWGKKYLDLEPVGRG